MPTRLSLEQTFEIQQQRKIRDILNSAEWSAGEKAVVKWQFRLHGHFLTALWVAITKADETNLRKLERGFPDEVEGYRAWTRGDLAKRLREIGLEI